MSFLFGVHAPNRLLCVAYTAVLLLHLPWPEPTWFYALWFALNWPTFGPKGRPKAEQQDKEEQLRQELHDYMDAHAGQCPPTTSALYAKFRRANLLLFLQEEKSAREEQLRQAQQQEKEEQLRQELCDYIDAHPCSPAVPARAALPSVAVPPAAAAVVLGNALCKGCSTQ